MDDAIPWEERRTIGLWRAFLRTLILTVREPNRFYALPPRVESPLPALLYGFLFEVPVALSTFVYQKAIGEAAFRSTTAGMAPALRELLPQAPELMDQAIFMSAFVSLFLAPVTYVIEVLFTALVTWVGLRITRNRRTSFNVLVQMLSYASWFRLFGLFGITGDVFLSALSFLLIFGFGGYTWLVMLRQTEQIDTLKAVYVSLAGGLVALALGCVVGIPLVVILAMWAISSVQLPNLNP